MPSIGRVLIVTGVILVVVGIAVTFWDKIPFIGRLPGDISFKRGNVTVYVPIVTSLVLSILLTLILFHDV